MDQLFLQKIEKISTKLEATGIKTISPSVYVSDFEGLEKQLQEMPMDDIDGLVLLVLTGGTEKMILKSAEKTSKPIILLTDSENNSLAAACEVIPELRSKGRNPKLIFSENLEKIDVEKIKKNIEVFQTIRKLKNLRLGLIGSRSPWLVSTIQDFELVKDKVGPTVVKVDFSEFLTEIRKIPDSQADGVSEKFLSNISESKEPSKEDVIQAVKIYLALKKLVKSHGLDFVTVGCFELIPEIDNTGCLALSKLIDEGIIAGCEGDLEATLTMVILNLLSSKPVWMANISSFDLSRNTIIFSHCTVSKDMLESPPVLRNHFESSTGVAIQGDLRKNAEFTIARLGGPKLDKMLLSSGIVNRNNLENENMCRTQAEIKLDGSVEDFIKNLLGNHTVLVEGDIRSKLRSLCNELDIETIGTNGFEK
ncbi:hypothetical protein AKJ62_04675 [candidate division MSBL1 archaeon SCGC-AAA259D14]|uniref:L-fucose isomerase C-terminal domain-containing protein n=2 Tax=candidate division MSBL1 TaxID=215777 RepID=A0A133U3C4_9EURY|nr:hypothetical protein AKJ62_04675 [candidate division MSBL1 archaeon SCGC-AAA259D14]KXA92463.1 hypothetical protein AKJ66_04115 [candidate division MSBL1 archaeon SCGC-AAA259E22]